LNLRRCSHLLNKGVVPLANTSEIRRGRHRTFSPEEAFHLILAFRLSELRILAGKNKKLVHAFYSRFGRMKQGPEDDFFPPRGEFDHEFDWHLVVARGVWMTVVPRHDVAVSLLGSGAPWFAPKRGRIERPPGEELQLGWIQVPLVPIAKCVAPV
jgi:hypothetical protein